MKPLKFTYSDSFAGMQKESFSKFSEIIKHIEDFEHKGEEISSGVVFQNNEPILEYQSSQNGLIWT